MSSNGAEETALTIIEAGQLVAKASPMDALALMSDQEFEQRLQSLKLAQKRMERIQKELMTEKVDYGIIPGTGDKPTLLKPGAEKLCKFHHLVPTFHQVTILGDGMRTPHLRVLTTCSLHYETEDGPIVAQGMGAANSWEKKYRYRNGQRRCPTCGAATIFRSKFPDKNTGKKGWYCFDKKGGCGAQFDEDDPDIAEQQQGEIENPDPFDGENTYAKISAKRAQTDATLRATATSGIWSQDLEDMVDADAPQQPKQQSRPQQDAQPQQATQPPKTSGKPQDRPATNEELDRWLSIFNEALDLGLDNLPDLSPTITIKALTLEAQKLKLRIAERKVELEVAE